MTELFLLTLYLEPPHSMLANQRNIFLLETNSVCLLSYSQSLLCLKQTFLSQNHPPDVLAYLFPWIEAEQAALEVQMSPLLPQSRHCFGSNFSSFCQWLHVVLVQDAAVLYSRYPTCPIFRFALFHLSELHHLLCQCRCPHCRTRGEGSLGVSQPSGPHGAKHSRGMLLICR